MVEIPIRILQLVSICLACFSLGMSVCNLMYRHGVNTDKPKKDKSSAWYNKFKDKVCKRNQKGDTSDN